MVSDGPVISKTVVGENGKTLELDYFMTRGTSHTDGAEGVPCFGISVSLSVDGEVSDSSTVDDVSPSEETARRILQLLAKNLVTPVSLKDVVEDCLAMQI